MKASIIRTAAHATGWFCLVIAVSMLIPMFVDLIDGAEDWRVFLSSAILVGIFATMTIISTRGEMAPFSLRLGFVMVNVLWWVTALTSALPFYISSLDLSFTDSIFESISGITTTGSTVLSGLDEMPRGILLWRSMIQWFGGIGFIAMGLLIMPFLRIGGMQIFQMESSNRLDSPVPKFRALSLSLVLMYLLFSFACAALYAVSGMSVFDAVNHAMTTISTGGYSTHDASLGYFDDRVLVVSIIFMLAGAMPFVALLRALVMRDVRKALDPQVPVLIGILLVLSALVAALAIQNGLQGSADLLLASVFNIISVVTTTGYASTDYTLWGNGVIGVVLLATFLGGCAGSTAGGIKTYRLIVLYQMVRNALRELIYPHGMFVERYGEMVLPNSAVRSVTVFMAGFMFVLLVGTVALAMTGLDLITAFSGTLTALTNVGPGLGPVIGPAGNFASLPDAAKLILCLVMMAGRLEILTVAVLFNREFWRS